jgi:hypothetical protein
VVWWRHTRGMHGDGLTQGLGAKGTRGAHAEHAAHVSDAGGVETQRLVEGRRFLPSRREGMRCGRERCEPGGVRACVGCVVAAHKRHARGWPDVRPGGQGHARRAHGEHVAHVCDAGGVKAQRLAEGRRALPSRREGMRCGGERCEPGGVRACGVVAAHKRHARGWPDVRPGGQGHAQRAHREHVAHVCDAGGVEAQRLVEGRRVLPSRREGMRRCGGGEVQAGRREGLWCGGGTQEACTAGMA